MFCPHCGALIESENALFCPVCGEQIAASPEEVPGEETAPAEETPENEQDPKKPQRRKGLIAAIILIVIAVVVVVVVVIAVSSRRSSAGDVVADTTEVAEDIPEEEEPEEIPAPEDTTEEPEPDQDAVPSAYSYILPNSDTRYYTASELAGFTKDQLRLARNEIYARHGRMFDSQDLQDYFDSQPWYQGTIAPADFSDSVLNKYELANIKTIQEMEDDSTGSVTGQVTGPDSGTDDSLFDATWSMIQSHGFDGNEWYDTTARDYRSDALQYSPLSFELVGGTAVDEGDYYAVQTVLSKALRVPADLQPGESCTVVINELTGEKKTFTCYSDGGGIYYGTDDGWECWPYNEDSDGMAELSEDSDDRLDVPFYQGVLRINKDAVTGSAITNGPYDTVTLSGLSQDDWFNVVGFDKNGYVAQLIYEGD